MTLIKEDVAEEKGDAYDSPEKAIDKDTQHEIMQVSSAIKQAAAKHKDLEAKVFDINDQLKTIIQLIKEDKCYTH